MPKEIIGDTNRRSVADVLAGSDPEPLPFLQVGWDRDCGLVQIATRQGGDFDEAEFDRPGFFVDLSRHDINRLIRTLRKARDAAFGSDA